jgi:oligopeptide transport system substrate-binding protein
MKKVSLNLIAVLMLLSMGCTKMNKPESILINLPSLDLTIDPHKMEDAYSMTAIIQLYRGLFRYSPEGDLKADIAESWTESADHKIFSFTLNDQSFSDGSKITSKNVVMSFARIFYLGASIGADIDYIQGAKKFKKSHEISDLGITMVNERTVQFKLENPSALFFKHLATVDCAILPILKFDVELAQDDKLVASGPYKIIRRDSGSIQLEKWRKDRLDSEKPPQKIVLFKADPSSIENLLDEGKTDSLDDDELTQKISEKAKAKGWAQFVTEIARERFLIMDPKRIPESTRRYLAAQVDPEEIIRKLTVSYLIPAYGLIPVGIPGALSKQEAAGYRKSLLGTPSPKGEVSLVYGNHDELSKNLALILKEKWDKDNFRVRLQSVDRSVLLARMFKKDFEIILGGKGIDYPDGYSVLTYFKGGYEGNYFNVDNPEINLDLNRLITTFDQSEREGQYKKIQLKILNQFTVIPLFFGSASSGFWSAKVASVPSHPMGLHTLPFETIKVR